MTSEPNTHESNWLVARIKEAGEQLASLSPIERQYLDARSRDIRSTFRFSYVGSSLDEKSKNSSLSDMG